MLLWVRASCTHWYQLIRLRSWSLGLYPLHCWCQDSRHWFRLLHDNPERGDGRCPKHFRCNNWQHAAVLARVLLKIILLGHDLLGRHHFQNMDLLLRHPQQWSNLKKFTRAIGLRRWWEALRERNVGGSSRMKASIRTTRSTCCTIKLEMLSREA